MHKIQFLPRIHVHTQNIGLAEGMPTLPMITSSNSSVSGTEEADVVLQTTPRNRGIRRRMNTQNSPVEVKFFKHKRRAKYRIASYQSRVN